MVHTVRLVMLLPVLRIGLMAWTFFYISPNQVGLDLRPVFEYIGKPLKVKIISYSTSSINKHNLNQCDRFFWHKSQYLKVQCNTSLIP
jgi:hypothetical protein